MIKRPSFSLILRLVTGFGKGNISLTLFSYAHIVVPLLTYQCWTLDFKTGYS